MSVEIPKAAVVFGSVTPPQGDIVDLRVHLGCTQEVSSFECLLQNWNKKYSSGETDAISVGMDGHIDIGRGTNVPQIITCRVESVKYESIAVQNFLRVSGRCWGEKLFRRVVTKTYENQKGETIVKDLMDSFAGLSHVRDSTEFIAASADKNGVIGYDFRVAPDGKFEFFPRNSKSSSLSLSEKIEFSEYRKDIHGIRNKIWVYGAADKSVPSDKDAWTESLTPADGSWSGVSGSVSLENSKKVKGSYSIKTNVSTSYYAASMFTLDSGKEVNANLYSILNFWIQRESAFNGNVNLVLYDSADKIALLWFTIGADEWFQKQFKVGAENADVWDVESGFDWTDIKKIRFDVWFDASGSGSFWIDGLFFGGRRYSSMQENAASQSSYGLRELVEVDEELFSDAECELRAKALLAHLKDPAEYLTVRSTVIDFGSSPVLPGDKVNVVLPNENVDADFRILSVEYFVDAKTQTLEITLKLGREEPLLADYLYALRSKTDHLSRHKIARLI